MNKPPATHLHCDPPLGRDPEFSKQPSSRHPIMSWLYPQPGLVQLAEVVVVLGVLAGSKNFEGVGLMLRCHPMECLSSLLEIYLCYEVPLAFHDISSPLFHLPTTPPLYRKPHLYPRRPYLHIHHRLHQHPHHNCFNTQRSQPPPSPLQPSPSPSSQSNSVSVTSVSVPCVVWVSMAGWFLLVVSWGHG